MMSASTISQANIVLTQFLFSFIKFYLISIEAAEEAVEEESIKNKKNKSNVTSSVRRIVEINLLNEIFIFAELSLLLLPATTVTSCALDSFSLFLIFSLFLFLFFVVLKIKYFYPYLSYVSFCH